MRNVVPSRKQKTVLSTELYTTEASESREKTKEELKIPDPDYIVDNLEEAIKKSAQEVIAEISKRTKDIIVSELKSTTRKLESKQNQDGGKEIKDRPVNPDKS